MKILDARWSPGVNILLIGCECGKKFEHPANRKTVRCECGREASLFELRERIDKGDVSIIRSTSDV